MCWIDLSIKCSLYHTWSSFSFLSPPMFSPFSWDYVCSIHDETWTLHLHTYLDLWISVWMSCIPSITGVNALIILFIYQTLILIEIPNISISLQINDFFFAQTVWRPKLCLQCLDKADYILTLMALSAPSFVIAW